MPIEIKELIVRTTVKTDAKSSAETPAVSTEDLARLKEDIKRECLDWLLEYLESKKMR